MKKLRTQHASPINFLKHNWAQIAPDWAKSAIPYLIKDQTLIMKTGAPNAMILQFRETELLKIARTIINNPIERIKIIKS